VLGCSNDKIPTSLTAPFEVTRISILRNATPALGSILTPGQTTTFLTPIAYTLSAADAGQVNDLFIVLDFYLANNKSFMPTRDVGRVGDNFFLIDAISGTGIGSTNIAIPNNVRPDEILVLFVGLVRKDTGLIVGSGGSAYWKF
jgi:hypothetical protein